MFRQVHDVGRELHPAELGSEQARAGDPRPKRAIRSRRVARCPDCWLAKGLCLCDELPTITASTRVVVVMHRREAITSTNTGRLAVRVLEGARMIVRGSLRGGDIEPLPEGPRLTLFPSEGARVLSAADAKRENLVLLVPDGSWAQARRLARRDETMRGTEMVTLASGPPSRYGLRRNAREGGLCTLEAIAAALRILEGPAIADRLDAVLDLFVERAFRVRRGEVA